MKTRKKQKNPTKQKSIRKKVRITALLLTGFLLLGILSVALLNLYVITKADDYIVTAEEAKKIGADCIIVLGALVYGDDELSDILEHRVMTAVSLYKDGVSDRILMSGDNSRESYNEVRAMKLYAVSKGVEADDVFMDKAGFSTYETMYRAKEIYKAQRVIIVTQEFHISRAIYLARSLGLEAYGVTSDLGKYKSESYNNLRELAARVKAVYSAVVQPEPKYLGDAIPISGKGSDTHDEGDKQIFKEQPTDT